MCNVLRESTKGDGYKASVRNMQNIFEFIFGVIKL